MSCPARGKPTEHVVFRCGRPLLSFSPLSYEMSESITKLLNGLPNGSAITFCFDQLGALGPISFADATDHYTHMQRVAETCRCSFHIDEKTRNATFTKIPLIRKRVAWNRSRFLCARDNWPSRSVITVNKRTSSHFASLVVVAIALCGPAAAVLWNAASPRQSATSVVASVAPEKLASADSPPRLTLRGHGQPAIRVTTVGTISLGNDPQRSFGQSRAPDRFHQAEPAAGKATRAQSETVPKQQLGVRSNRNSAQNSSDALLFRPWWYSWR